MDQFLQAGRLGARYRRERRPLHHAHGRARRPEGRVIAVEPVPDTFALLSENVRHFGHANVSLLNCAASDSTSIVGMDIPRWSDGLQNFYQAHIVPRAGGLAILALTIDSLNLSTVRVVKIDAEGHELSVLKGMRKLLVRDQPTLIVETSATETSAWLAGCGYSVQRLPGSSNLLCTRKEVRSAA